MKKGEKSTRTLNIEKIAEFFMLQPETVEKKLKEETKVSNMHVKKAYSNLCNGLPYYDMNKILRLVSIEISNHYICRFMLIWNINYDGKIRQELECVCDGKIYTSKQSGIEGINSILEQIGFDKRLSEPKDFNNLVVWKELEHTI